MCHDYHMRYYPRPLLSNKGLSQQLIQRLFHMDNDALILHQLYIFLENRILPPVATMVGGSALSPISTPVSAFW